MTESPLFYSIKDVAKQLGLPSHVLRFWETKFPEIKPVHRSGSCRYYRKEDVDLLIRIQDLLHNQGYTIKGARSILGKSLSANESPALQASSVGYAATTEMPSNELKVETAADSVSSLSANTATNNAEVINKLHVLRDFVKNALEEPQKS